LDFGFGDCAGWDGLSGGRLLLLGQQVRLIKECKELVFPENAVKQIRGEWPIEPLEVKQIPLRGFTIEDEDATAFRVVFHHLQDHDAFGSFDPARCDMLTNLAVFEEGFDCFLTVSPTRLRQSNKWWTDIFPKARLMVDLLSCGFGFVNIRPLAEAAA
jgi:hypothetical protein